MGIKNSVRLDEVIYPEGCGLVQYATTCAAKFNLFSETMHRCLDIVGVDNSACDCGPKLQGTR